jgi:hypothetical protein
VTYNILVCTVDDVSPQAFFGMGPKALRIKLLELKNVFITNESPEIVRRTDISGKNNEYTLYIVVF